VLDMNEYAWFLKATHYWRKWIKH